MFMLKLSMFPLLLLVLIVLGGTQAHTFAMAHLSAAPAASPYANAHQAGLCLPPLLPCPPPPPPLAFSCSGTELAVFTPGKMETPRRMTITTTATFGPCTLSIASDDPIIGGTADYQKINPSEGCRGSYAGASFWETFHWRTAQGKSLISVVSFSGTKVIDQEGATEEVKVQASGKVLEGTGVGDTVNMLLDLTDADPVACSSAGGLQVEAGSVSVEFLLPLA